MLDSQLVDNRNNAEARIKAIDTELASLLADIAELGSVPPGRAEVLEPVLALIDEQAEAYRSALLTGLRAAASPRKLAPIAAMVAMTPNGPKFRTDSPEAIDLLGIADKAAPGVPTAAKLLAILGEPIRAALVERLGELSGLLGLPEQPALSLAERGARASELAGQVERLSAERAEQIGQLRQASNALARALGLVDDVRVVS